MMYLLNMCTSLLRSVAFQILLNSDSSRTTYTSFHCCIPMNELTAILTSLFYTTIGNYYIMFQSSIIVISYTASLFVVAFAVYSIIVTPCCFLFLGEGHWASVHVALFVSNFARTSPSNADMSKYITEYKSRNIIQHKAFGGLVHARRS